MSTHRGCRVDNGQIRGERDRESSFPGVFLLCFSFPRLLQLSSS